tara:strand:- start:4576 stop:4764 length:189 start_codon:yes stop_codon:yes gene_type:complete
MTQDEKAQLYDDLLRAGDTVRREISKLKANTISGMSPEDEQTLTNLKQQLTNLEQQVQRLIT